MGMSFDVCLSVFLLDIFYYKDKLEVEHSMDYGPLYCRKVEKRSNPYVVHKCLTCKPHTCLHTDRNKIM